MNIVFVSNYINHHQIPLSDNLYKLSGGNYTFIQTEPMEEERVKMGWDTDSVNKPYVKLYYNEKEECDRLILESDCVIFGGAEDENIIRPRLIADKFTIRYSERLYKEGRWKFISPRGLKKKYHDHTMFRHNQCYMLCAGAYVKGDYSLVHAYGGKMLKFGYFPKTERYDNLNELRKENKRCEIMWAARFIDWKHPEMMVKLAGELVAKKINAHITMIGVGELLEDTIKATKEAGLSEIVSFVSNKTPDEVRDMMRRSNIFVSTSDMKEGWGAVINEAMNSGCVTIAAKQIGAAPYLIKNGVNGFTYSARNDRELADCVIKAASDLNLSNEIAGNAYDTIVNLWNAEVAAARLYDFIEDKEHKIPDYKDGPLSRA